MSNHIKRFFPAIRIRGLALACSCAIVLAACGSDGSPEPEPEPEPEPTPTPAPATAAIVVENNAFRSQLNGTDNPARDTVAVGGTVTWTWTSTGSVPHNVNSTGGGGSTWPGSGLLQGDGVTYSHTFTQAGTYSYNCVIHDTMSGTLVVR